MLNPEIEKSVKMALIRGTRSKLPGVREISSVLMAQIQTLKMAESQKTMPTWWKPFWRKVRKAVKQAGRVCHEVADDAASLMQYLHRIPAFAEYKIGDRFWVAKMLQRELEMLQAMQKGVGAKIRQLMQMLEAMEGTFHEGVRDLVDMLKAVAVTFQDDDMDERQPDQVDVWTQTWMMRIGAWLDMETSKLNSVVVVEDSVDMAIEDGAKKESAFVEMVVELQKRLMALAIEEETYRLKRSAAVAQAWDDWAIRQAWATRPVAKGSGL